MGAIMSILEQISVTEDRGKRVELAREVAGLFFAAEERGLQSTQVDAFGEVMSTLLKAMPLQEQVSLSERISSSEKAPHELIMTIARSEVEVAAHVIEKSPVLTEDNLIDLSENTSTEHRVALSRRDDLTARVTDSLISFEENQVMHTVAANPTAQISNQGFSTLTKHGTQDEMLRAHLVERPDLPIEEAERILPLLDDEARAKFIALMAENGKALQTMIVKAKVEVSLSKISASKRRLEAKALAGDVEHGHKSLDEVTLKLSEERRPKCLATVFADISLLSESKTYHAISDMDGELIMLMCRALDLQYITFRSANEMRRDMLKMPPESEDGLEEKYQKLSVESAQKTMRFVNIVLNN